MTERVTNICIPALLFIVLELGMRLSSSPSLSKKYSYPTGSADKIYSRILGEERTISVALPDGYLTSRAAYPVLYVLDAEGQKLFPECVSTIRDLYEKGHIPQLIVVGIWNTERNRDMIPVPVSHRPGSGGSASFLEFIQNELMPYINQNYRTRDFSILYGMSNSALFTVYALLERPDVFDAYIASSPMIGHCPDAIQKKTERFLEKGQSKDRILYMIYGTEDSRRVIDYVPDFQNYLKTNAPQDFESKLEILEGEGHVPDSSLERGLKFVYSQAR